MLEIERLVDSAVGRLGGAEALGSPTWRPGLEALVASANDEAHLNEMGELTLRTQIAKSLTNRVQVVDWHRRHPEVGEVAVDAPVVILGLPRTGTTLLSYLLDRDPANRSLLRGECLASTPPPETATLRTDRRILDAQAEMDALYDLLPEFKAVHYESGDGPTECITVLGQDFRSVHYETLAHLPGYSDWHRRCDMVPAYRWHRQVLQVLGWRAPGRWVLKSPCHNLALDALDAVYPDARFVVPHRDPTVAVGSLASLVTMLAGLGTDADRRSYVGAHWLEVAGQMLDGLLWFRDRVGDDRFFDVDYEVLVADPLGTVGELYDWLGRPLTAGAESAMAAYLIEAPPGRFGTHEYELADFGLTEGAVRERTAPYRRRFAS
jgi:hypothetical protein